MKELGRKLTTQLGTLHKDIYLALNSLDSYIELALVTCISIITPKIANGI